MHHVFLASYQSHDIKEPMLYPHRERTFSVNEEYLTPNLKKISQSLFCYGQMHWLGISQPYKLSIVINLNTFSCMHIFRLSQNSSAQFKCTRSQWAVSHLNITSSCSHSLAMTSSFPEAIGLSIPAHTVAALLNREIAMANLTINYCSWKENVLINM